MALNRHFSNPAALAFACPRCKAAPGVMCSGRSDRPANYYSMHKAREKLAEMPDDRAEWDRRMALIREAFGQS